MPLTKRITLMAMANITTQRIVTTVGSAMRKIDLRELTCQYPSHIKPGAK